MALKKKVSKAPKKAKVAKPSAKKPAKKAPAKKSVVKKTSVPAKAKAKAKKAPAKPVKNVVSKKPAAKKSPAKKAPQQVMNKPVIKPVVAKAPQQVMNKPVIKPAVAKASPVKALPKEAPLKRPNPASKKMVGPVEIAPYQPGVNEEYMSEEQLEHFRLILNQWKDQLMQEVDSTVGHMKEEAILYPDPLDRAAQEEGFNLELRTRDRERRLIKKIEMSLDKIDNGEYGFCQSCGTEIGLRRLEARPTADKCIDCKTFEEIREKQSGL